MGFPVTGLTGASRSFSPGSPYVAAPGTSEHQSGLALDLSCPAIRMELIPEFAFTSEGKWLARNASLYGLFSAILKIKNPSPAFLTNPGISATSPENWPDI